MCGLPKVYIKTDSVNPDAADTDTELQMRDAPATDTETATHTFHSWACQHQTP
jgi:hypothetical protein